MRQRLELYAICAMLALSVLAAYQEAPRNGFAYDDYGYILLNESVQKPLSLDTIRWAFTTNYSGNWHPLTWLSHALDCRIYGLNPAGHHLTSVLIHIANTLLLFALMCMATGLRWPSAFAAVLFGVHPLHVESVAWISERKDLLSAFFGILAAICYVSYARSPARLKYIGVIGFFALGLMSKPMLVTLPFVLLLMDYWPLERLGRPETAGGTDMGVRSLRRLFVEKLPLFALSAASAVVTFFAQRTGSTMANLQDVSLPARLANAVVSCAVYVRKMFWPADLAAFYPHPRGGIPVSSVIASAAFLAAVTWAVVRFRSRRWLLVGWLWYIVTLLPVIGLIQVGGQAMADRYTYMPFIGLFIIAAWGFRELSRPRLAAAALAALAAAVSLTLVFAARAQVRHWKNNETLFSHALKHTRDNWVASYTLGLALSDTGRFREALPHAREAVRLQPYNPSSHMLLGRVLIFLKKRDEAIESLRKAVEIAPGYAEARALLAYAYLLNGDTEAAREEAELSAALEPDNQTAQYVLRRLK